MLTRIRVVERRGRGRGRRRRGGHGGFAQGLF